MISAAELFVRRFDELAATVPILSDYGAIRASAILRQLLFDATPLIHVVNGNHKLRIRFRTAKRRTSAPSAPEPEFELPVHGILVSPDAPPDSIDELSLDKFLKLTVYKIRGQCVSVQTLLEVAAHKLGGVHLDRNLSPDQQQLFDAFNLIGGSLMVTMDAIVRLVLESLLPLRDKALTPPPMAMFAHYRPAPWRPMRTGINGEGYATDLDADLKQGFSFYGIAQVLQEFDVTTDLTIYELGCPGIPGPRFSLSIRGRRIVCEFPGCTGTALRLEVDEPLFDLMRSGAHLLAVELDLTGPQTTLRRFTPERPVPICAKAALPLLGGRVTRQTFGCTLEGNGVSRLGFREIILLDRALQGNERRELLKYFRIGHDDRAPIPVPLPSSW